MNYKNYPMIKMQERNFLLGIYPKWHTRLFPESILRNENESIIEDVSHTNSIHKVYLTKMHGVPQLRAGDNLLIYRTSDGQGSARFRSVATSMCVVEEYRNIHEFGTLADFKTYCAPYSVFSDAELNDLYRRKTYPFIIKFSYNFPLKRKVIRQNLMDITGYADGDYWGFLTLTNAHLVEILRAGGVNESLVVD
ncbi:hypothetical protein [Klebsiella oxytoca]|uniref:hypothetical protein n=1 Tax=Klebsiella oxytoca TaxID=571 RepID=UPI00163C8CE8|nr:hypothetical protein [Klebsiella oxytoca]ELT9681867.1 hypothetical protein [Klebsiella oxytoca]ELT9975487.1 hypothetical protein [Klebsiella oxytoca]MBL6085497.1 hypothetical protein [Klebsiella oxytoca]MBL6252116.1 hypothetical protein [Klebsiella oxytoca]MBL6269521.1 hypothetical protein [Klebsiella oxytoca]